MPVVSPRQIKFTRWYLDHKKEIKKTIYGILIFLIILWWGIFIYNLVIFIKGIELHQENLEELTKDRINYAKFHDRFQPEDVYVDTTRALQTGESIYDFIARIHNPNKNWRVNNLEYKFTWSGGETNIKKIFLMPDSNVIAASFREKVVDLNGLDFVIKGVDWKRVRKKDKRKLQILSRIKISEPKVDFVVPKDQMVSLPKVSFKIKNESIYSFWEIPCLVLLFDNTNIVGVHEIPVKKLESEQERTISFRWNDIPSAYSIQIIPLLDVFNQQVYMPVK